METYLIVIGKTSTGYSRHCPDVLGLPPSAKRSNKSSQT